MSNRPHALVVGGTGMLRGVSLHLAEQGHTVSVVARRMPRLRALGQDGANLPGGIVPLALDYRDSEHLRAALAAAQQKHGPISLAVCWIHSVAPDAPEVVAEAVGSGPVPCRFFHVRGSAVQDPSRADPGAKSRLFDDRLLRYRQVVLGFVRESGRSRWLTDDEISAGIIAAIAEDRPRSVIGVVDPWSARP